MAKVAKSSKKSKKRKSSRLKKADKEQIVLIKSIVVLISGQGSEKIVDLLYGKVNVNEFDIAKKMQLTINQARNILYKLADFGLVGFTRKKDQKNGGWYTYFWTIDKVKALQVLRGKISKDIEKLRTELESRESKRYYHCENCEIEMIEEDALLHNFTCPECGEVFKLKDNSEEITHLESHLTELRSDLGIVDTTLETVEAILEEQRLKDIEKERVLKAAARKAAAKKTREKRKAEAAKLLAAEGKVEEKPVKKTVKRSTKKGPSRARPPSKARPPRARPPSRARPIKKKKKVPIKVRPLSKKKRKKK